MMKKTVRINWNGREEEVVVRELTWGEYNKLLSEVIQVKMVGNLPQTQFDFAKYRIMLMKMAIEKAPFDKDEVENLPVSIASKIWQAVTELNPLLV